MTRSKFLHLLCLAAFGLALAPASVAGDAAAQDFKTSRQKTSIPVMPKGRQAKRRGKTTVHKGTSALGTPRVRKPTIPGGSN